MRDNNINASHSDNKEKSRNQADLSKKKISSSSPLKNGSIRGERQKYAILVIDMINDFVKGKLKCESCSNNTKYKDITRYS